MSWTVNCKTDEGNQFCVIVDADEATLENEHLLFWVATHNYVSIVNRTLVGAYALSIVESAYEKS